MVMPSQVLNEQQWSTQNKSFEKELEKQFMFVLGYKPNVLINLNSLNIIFRNIYHAIAFLATCDNSHATLTVNSIS